MGNKHNILVKKIVSGGQTGVDRAALDAAIHNEVEYGGWLPRGRKCEDGPLDGKYVAMAEMPTSDYLKRTEQNVIDSDGTLILCSGEPSGGTKRTIDFCIKHGRPYEVVDLDEYDWDMPPPVWTEAMIESIAKKAGKDEIVLNVAGPRESKAPGVYEKARVLMGKVLGYMILAEKAFGHHSRMKGQFALPLD